MTIASHSVRFARHAPIDLFHHRVPGNVSKGSQVIVYLMEAEEAAIPSTQSTTGKSIRRDPQKCYFIYQMVHVLRVGRR